MIIDFLSAALPWVVMCLTVAIAAVMLRRRAAPRKGFRAIAILWYCCAFARRRRCRRLFRRDRARLPRQPLRLPICRHARLPLGSFKMNFGIGTLICTFAKMQSNGKSMKRVFVFLAAALALVACKNSQNGQYQSYTDTI